MLSIQPATPWQSSETDTRIVLAHDHRWLKVLGIPLAALGALVAISVWWIPGIDKADAWPMLVVGSLIGTALVLMGLHLSLNRVFFVADRVTRELLQYQGFGWFARRRRTPFADLQRVRVLRRSLAGADFSQYILEITTAKRSILVAAYPEREPIEMEAVRWSAFLGIPLHHG